MSLDLFVTITTVLVNSVIGLIVIFQNPKRRANKNFFLFLAFLIAWKVTLTLYLNTNNEDFLLQVGRVNFASSSLLAYFVFRFANYFPNDKYLYIKNKLLNIIFNLSTLALVFVTLLTPLISKDENIVGAAKTTEFGSLYILYVIHLLFFLGFCLFILFRKLWQSEGIVREQLKLISVAFLITVIFALTTNILLPFVFNNFNFQDLGPVATIAVSISIFTSIVRYKFLDTKIIIGRILYFALVSIFTYSIFYALILFYETFLGGVYTNQSYLAGIFISVIFVLSYNYINNVIRENIQSKIINPDFNPDKETANFNNMISTILNIDEINEKSLDFMLRVLKVKNAVLYIVNEDGFMIKAAKEDGIPAETFQTIYATLKTIDSQEIINDEIELYEKKDFGIFEDEIKTIYSINKANGIKYIGKLKAINNQSGACFIIDNDSETFSFTKIKFLRSIIDLLSLSLGRAYLYKEVQKFNSTLQQKIDNATTELTSKNQQLEEALRKERDMLDILGHELRTPLSTSRNSLNIIDIYKKQGKLDEANLNHHLDIAKENLTREIKILETILSSSRIDNSRLQLNNEEVEANDVIEDSVLSYKEQAEKKGLTIKTVLPTDKIYCYGDRSATQQIIDNLVSNAIKYTQKGSVTLETKLEGENVVFAVSDTGEGIPANEIPNLGKKFYRINPYLESDGKIGDRQIVRPGGTGIGLYVVFKLAAMMNGTISVASEVGKGSTFTVKLPRFNPQIHEIKKIVEEQQPVKAAALVV